MGSPNKPVRRGKRGARVIGRPSTTKPSAPDTQNTAPPKSLFRQPLSEAKKKARITIRATRVSGRASAYTALEAMAKKGESNKETTRERNIACSMVFNAAGPRPCNTRPWLGRTETLWLVEGTPKKTAGKQEKTKFDAARETMKTLARTGS